jgi:hypothetical protein
MPLEKTAVQAVQAAFQLLRVFLKIMLVAEAVLHKTTA